MDKRQLLVAINSGVPVAETETQEALRLQKRNHSSEDG